MDYFRNGRSVFFVNVQGQIAASDANRDGHTLSSSDIVYLWRQVHNQAAQVVLEGKSSYKLLLDGWETVCHYEDSVTRILVYDPTPDMSQTFEDEFLKAYGNVVSIDLSTSEGGWMHVTIGRP